MPPYEIVFYITLGIEDMKMSARIDTDCQSMDRYFHKLFALLQEARAEDELAPIEVHDYDADESQASYHCFSHLIKPDMLINTYSLVDFWMNEICEYHKKNNNLILGSKDINGKNDFHARHKYLTKYAGLDLSAVEDSYKRLTDLLKVRNRFIHGGGYAPSGQETEFSAINGITLLGSLIVIDSSFVWSTLEHAKKYLQAAVQA